ncbi:hypothetical protein L195_g016852 [Trifolium pratense]|uniref:Uncharacterized protein n=1 Tax=Trifolium pratense TaxID=57577 RepID=A0A2K3MSG6_TRIPR|nr:hypothetical protein L195_g016852 [Trifolium pratense]
MNLQEGERHFEGHSIPQRNGFYLMNFKEDCCYCAELLQPVTDMSQAHSWVDTEHDSQSTFAKLVLMVALHTAVLQLVIVAMVEIY